MKHKAEILARIEKRHVQILHCIPLYCPASSDYCSLGPLLVTKCVSDPHFHCLPQGLVYVLSIDQKNTAKNGHLMAVGRSTTLIDLGWLSVERYVCSILILYNISHTKANMINYIPSSLKNCSMAFSRFVRTPSRVSLVLSLVYPAVCLQSLQCVSSVYCVSSMSSASILCSVSSVCV